MKDRWPGILLSVVALGAPLADTACSAPAIPAETLKYTPTPIPGHFETIIPGTKAEIILPFNKWPVWITSLGFGFKYPEWNVVEDIPEKDVTVKSPDFDTTLDFKAEKTPESEDNYTRRVSQAFGGDQDTHSLLTLKRKNEDIPSFVKIDGKKHTVETIFLFVRNHMGYRISISSKIDNPSTTVVQNILNSINWY